MKRWLIRWWRSYIIVLLIPVIFGSLAYGRAITAVNNAIDRGLDTSIRQVRLLVDNQIDTARNVAGQFFVDQGMLSLSLAERRETTSQQVSIMELLRRMRAVTQSNSSVGNIYIYFEALGSVLSTDKMWREEHFPALSRQIGISPEKLDSAFISMSGTTYDYLLIPEKGNLLYIQSLNRTLAGKNVVVAIEMVRMDADIRAVAEASGCVISVYDGSSAYIESTRNSAGGIFNYPEIPRDGTGFTDSDFMGEHYVVKSIISDRMPIIYLSAISRDVYSADARSLGLLLVLYIVLCLAVGVAISYLLVRRNYSQVAGLLETLNTRLGELSTGDRDDFTRLGEKLEEALSGGEFARRQLERREREAGGNRLRDLLHGYGGQDGEETIPYESFRILLLRMTELGSINSYGGSSPEQAESIADFILQNVMGELMQGTGYDFIETGIDGMLAYIISRRGGEEDTGDIIRPVSTGIDFIGANFEAEVYCALGHAGTPREAAAVYGKTVELMRYLELTGAGNTAVYDEIITAGDNYTEFKEYNKFYNLMLCGEYDSAKELIEGELKSGFEFTGTTRWIRMRLHGIINTLVSVLSGIRPSTGPLCIDSRPAASVLAECQSIPELRERIGQLFAELELSKLENPDSDDGRIRELLKYLETNYADLSLNVNTLSDRFGVSRHYATKAAKSITGYNLLDYIHKVRLERAKQLLPDRSLSIKEIAAEVGFANDAALNRAFYKYEGVSAGVYRSKRGR